MTSPHPTPPLPSLPAQAAHLIDLGVPERAGLDPARVRDLADAHADQQSDTEAGAPPPLLVLPGAPIAYLAGLMHRQDGRGRRKQGFIVQDMTDVEQFTAVPGLDVPPGPYLVKGLERGDALRNASPEEGQAHLDSEGRSPLTLAEGVFWVLADPEVLQPNHCFMTIASRRPRPRGGFDARTPALWISGGTGRDGAERKDAPKVGWCWWRNRHTWLGIASASGRIPL